MTREEQAKAEIGRTDIRRGLAWAFSAVFVATVVAVPAAQHVYEIPRNLSSGGGSSGGWTASLPQCYDIFRSLPAFWRAVRGQGGAETLGSAGPTDSLWRRIKFANDDVLLRQIESYQDALKDDSLLADVLLPPAQRLLAGWLGAGNEQAYVGRDGWLFYRPEVDYVTGPGFLSLRHRQRRDKAVKAWQDAPAVDPVPAIAEFAAQLDRRGIRLVLLPTPCKPMIHPEGLSRRFDGASKAAQNPSFDEFKRRLAGHSVLVLDLADELAAMKAAGGATRDLYLRTDTHWRPETMEFVAGRLARVVSDILAEVGGLSASASAGGTGPGDGPSGWHAATDQAPVRVTNIGDIAAMLQPTTRTAPGRAVHAAAGEALSAVGLGDLARRLLSDDPTIFAPETVTIQPVAGPDGRPWRPDPTAEVLLLGDSFSNVYSSGEMGWGASAGLAERLSVHLRRPVDAIIRNDAGSYATRQILAQEMLSGRDRLAGKKAVIWQFAIRELTVGDWKRLPLPAPATPASAGRWFQLAPGRQIAVTGRIAAVAPTPPGKLPYKDHIMSIHLKDIRDAAGTVRSAEAIVLLWGMRDNTRTPAVRLRVGQDVAVRVRPWGDVMDKYGRFNRSLIAEADIEAPLLWCEELK